MIRELRNSLVVTNTLINILDDVTPKDKASFEENNATKRTDNQQANKLSHGSHLNLRKDLADLTSSELSMIIDERGIKEHISNICSLQNKLHELCDDKDNSSENVRKINNVRETLFNILIDPLDSILLDDPRFNPAPTTPVNVFGQSSSLLNSYNTSNLGTAEAFSRPKKRYSSDTPVHDDKKPKK